jgi:hypothetical protein
LLDLIARLGLACYVRALDNLEPTLRLLLEDSAAAARNAGLDRFDWPDQRAALVRAWRQADGPLRALALHLQLTDAELFMLGLAIACERHRAVTLAVSTLQAPFAAARPSVHLAIDLLEVLFPDWCGDALSLASGPMMECGLLSPLGEDALPQRVLAVRLPLWRALCGSPPAWPGCRPIDLIGEAAIPMPAYAAKAIKAGQAGGVVVRGAPGSGRAAIAATLASQLGLVPIETPLAVFRDDRAFITACRFADWLPVLRLAPDLGESVLLGEANGPVAVLAGRHGAIEGNRLIEFFSEPPPLDERLRRWQTELGKHAIDPLTLGAAILYSGTIETVARAARTRASAESREAMPADLAAARLALAPDGLGRLAHPITRSVNAQALVTPPALAADLAALIARCRQRERIWDGLGPSLAASSSRGVRALFAGESGTGKTMAAAYVATALAAPLFRCDLAAVMNKYIGESEKNIGALLDHAEAADVVLLFDEADALFGRRTEGGETGERYANMLTNYLLTRLEAHNGIVILTTNAKMRIDPSFWRRLDFVIDFSLPGYEERLALWKSHLGARAPDNAVLERLASYCDLPGGGVRNAVLSAAAMAPPDQPIGREWLRPALQREYGKLRRTLPAGLALALRGPE